METSQQTGFIESQIASMNRDLVLSLTPPFPQNILLEPSSGCNHRCVFCSRQYGLGRMARLLSIELARRILVEGFQLGSREAGFYLDGEPLLHPKLPEMVNIASQVGYKYLYMTTNGALFNPSRQDQLIQAGLNSVKYSINAGNPEEYRSIHGRDDFEQVLENLEYSLQLKAKLANEGIKFIVSVSAVQIPETVTNINKLRLKYAARLDDFYITGASPRPQDASAIPQPNSIPCAMVFNRFHVTADGYFSACCIDSNNELILADLNQVSLSDAWFGVAAQELRQKHLSGKVDGTLCGRCKYGGTHHYTSLKSF
jgi:molybdenum cofactor biosynthesis enzyme MoaA